MIVLEKVIQKIIFHYALILNMNHMMKQAMKMREDLMKAKEEMKKKTHVGSSGGGAIKVTVNGGNRIEGIEIDPDAIDLEDPDFVDDLKELIIVAANNALEEIEKQSEGEMGKIAGGLSIPGLF